MAAPISVSDSVSEKFGIGKKIRIPFRSDFGYRHTLGHDPYAIIDHPAQDLAGWQLPYQQNRRSQSVNNPSQASADAQELSV